MNEAARSPLLGCNTEVTHRGEPFHVQTEDSGIGHPHVITHLFAGGGRIVATRKTTYASCIGTPRYPDLVKELIALQHLEMVTRLRRGAYDDLLTSRAHGAPPREEPPLDLVDVASFATRRRERATPVAGPVAAADTPPPPSARREAPSARRFDHARLSFREPVPSEEPALDELIVEQIAAYLAQDEGD
jgi:hypothetical protein